MYGKSNFRIILGSKPKVFNNIEAWQEIRYSYKVSFCRDPLSSGFTVRFYGICYVTSFVFYCVVFLLSLESDCQRL